MGARVGPSASLNTIPPWAAHLPLFILSGRRHGSETLAHSHGSGGKESSKNHRLLLANIGGRVPLKLRT